MKNRLRERREQLGFTQKQISDRIGVKQSQYQGYENERHDPVVSMAIKISQVLETSVEALWSG